MARTVARAWPKKWPDMKKTKTFPVRARILEAIHVLEFDEPHQVTSAQIYWHLSRTGKPAALIYVQTMLTKAFRDGILVKVGHGEYRTTEMHRRLGEPHRRVALRDAFPNGRYRPDEARMK